MANTKVEPPVKVENEGDVQNEQQENQQAGPPNFGGPKRGGHNNRFGNRRPGPYVSLYNESKTFLYSCLCINSKWLSLTNAHSRHFRFIRIKLNQHNSDNFSS
jgi:hypothetical protein